MENSKQFLLIRIKWELWILFMLEDKVLWERDKIMGSTCQSSAAVDLLGLPGLNSSYLSIINICQWTTNKHSHQPICHNHNYIINSSICCSRVRALRYHHITICPRMWAARVSLMPRIVGPNPINNRFKGPNNHKASLVQLKAHRSRAWRTRHQAVKWAVCRVLRH